MPSKLLVTGVAAAAAVLAPVAALTASGSDGGTATAVRLAVWGAPLPLDPAAPVTDLPTVEQLTGVLYGLADPNVPFASKSYLVEGGIGRLQARTADALMRNAVAKGQMPLSFAIGAIAPAGPGAATAAVTATGPTTPATTQTVTFVDQGGWKLSRISATAVLAMFSG